MSDEETLLKNVEETAEAMRVLNMLTQPIFKEIRRREAELCDEKALEECDSDDFKDSSVVFSSPLKLIDSSNSGSKPSSQSFDEESSFPTSPASCKRKSVWSPVKHAKVVDVEAVLKTEKTPVWKPLRKSKARQSLSCNLENVKSPQVDETKTPSFTSKSGAELRTPLKLMMSVHSNQAPLKTVGVEESESHLSLKESGSSDLDSVENASVSADITSSNTETTAKKTPPDVEGSQFQECVSSSEIMSSILEEPQAESDNFPVKSSASRVKTHSPVRCSPVLLQAYGEDVAKVRGCIGSPEKVVNLNECETTVDPSKVLKGVNAYVEVRRGEDDRTGGFRWKLKQLGASVSDTLNKKVTHVVFQEGLLSTFRKAKQLNICLVSAQWVMACDESYTKVPEENYPIEKLDQYELADPLTKYIRRPKVMSPDLGSGRDDKRLSRRFQRIQRRSMQVSSPLAKADRDPAKVNSDKNPVLPVETLTPQRNDSFKSDDDDNDDDDGGDDDGFLAMLEAQVREKAASRLKKEEAEKAVKEFEMQLKALLGRKGDSAAERGTSSVPLAKIFQPRTSLPSNQSKPSQKKKPKRSSEKAVSSSSFMRNWLKNKKTSLQESMEGSEKPFKFAAEAAVDALSDEILNSMIAEPPSCSKLAERNITHSPKTPAKQPSLSSCRQKRLAGEKPPLSTPTRSKSKSSQSSVRSSSTVKQKMQESNASCGVMEAWLAKGKLTAVPLVKRSSSLASKSEAQGHPVVQEPLKVSATEIVSNSNGRKRKMGTESKDKPNKKKNIS